MKSQIRRILLSIISIYLLVVPAAASSFPDVPDSAPCAEAAEYLNSVGIMQGDATGNFNPNKSVTRAQMAAILCRMVDESEDLTTDGDRFTDVPASYWANGYILKAAELGIISGYKDGTFKPDNTVTYEQAITMLVRTMELEESALNAGGYPSGYISVADEYGFTNNVTASAGQEMSRGQIAIMIYNTRV